MQCHSPKLGAVSRGTRLPRLACSMPTRPASGVLSAHFLTLKDSAMLTSARKVSTDVPFVSAILYYVIYYVSSGSAMITSAWRFSTTVLVVSVLLYYFIQYVLLIQRHTYTCKRGNTRSVPVPPCSLLFAHHSRNSWPRIVAHIFASNHDCLYLKVLADVRLANWHAGSRMNLAQKRCKLW